MPDTPRFEQFYQPIYEIPGKEDPVDFLQKAIQFSEYESLQLFSGFRGSGKTTELFRLKQRLEQEGYVVLYVDAFDYISPSDEIDISDLLIVLAGGFSDALEKWTAQLQQPVKLSNESFWTRIKNYLTRTTIQLTEAGLTVEADSPASQVLGGLKAGLDLKLAIKESPTFRQNVQKLMANRIGELRASVHQFFEEGVKAVKEVWGEDKQVVYIFDSLEQLRGSLTNEEGVLRSVERVFANHLNLLRLPYVHVVYTVPPWLQFVMPGSDIYLLPCIRLWNNNPERTHYL
nr:ATP-binding protein [Acidobacteriota bacterium]